MTTQSADPPRGRLARLFEAADRRHVPLRTILVTVAVVVATSWPASCCTCCGTSCC